jgi:hypothetical protein
VKILSYLAWNVNGDGGVIDKLEVTERKRGRLREVSKISYR